MRALLIDAMGTLLELQQPVAPLRAELLGRFGVAVSDAEAAAALRAEINFYRAHMACGRDPESLARLRRGCAEALRIALPAVRAVDGAALTEALLAALRFRAFDDAAPALEALRAGGVERIVVVSNWDSSLPEVLARVGLAPSVDAVITSAEVGVSKPGAEIFAAALARAEVPAWAAVHVGDSVAEDVAGARAGGIAPVLVARERPPAGDPGCPVIGGLSELPALFAGHR